MSRNHRIFNISGWCNIEANSANQTQNTNNSTSQLNNLIIQNNIAAQQLSSATRESSTSVTNSTRQTATTNNSTSQLNNLIIQKNIAAQQLSSAIRESSTSVTNLTRQTATTNNSTSQLINLRNESTRITTNLQRETNINTNKRSELNNLTAQENDLAARLTQSRIEESKIRNQLKLETTIIANKLQELEKIDSKLAKQNKEQGELDELMNLMHETVGNYTKIEGVKLSTISLIIDKLPSNEILNTNAAKDVCKDRCMKDFDEILDKIDNINAQDGDGMTLFMHAIANGFTYAIDKLLSRGADVNILDNQGSNALHYAASMPNTKSILQIIDQTDHINLKSAGFDGQAPLHILIANTNTIFFGDELANKDAYITSSIDGSITISGSLTIGSAREDGFNDNQSKIFKIIKYLVLKGGDINIQNNFGETPFFYACWFGFKYLANQMIDNFKLNYSLIDVYSHNSLIWAMNLNDISLLQKIINKGFYINEADKNGNVPIHWAASFNFIDVTSFLINSGANANLGREKDGITALHIAIAKSSLKLVKCLVEKGGADVNKCDKSEASPLYYSLGYNDTFYLDIVRYLIFKGADVNKPMFDGDTPMHMIGYKGNITAMGMLISKGSNINAINDEGKTPLHVLIARQEIPSHLKLIATKLFLSYGAKTDIIDNQGKSVTDLATEHFPEAVGWLEHPEKVPSFEVLESSYANEIANYKLPTLTANSHAQKNTVEVKQVTQIEYNNKLLNHFDLFGESIIKFGFDKAIDLSFRLSTSMIDQIIDQHDSQLLLGALISIEVNNHY